MERERAQDFDQRLLDLYDDYVHGRLSRREFARKAATFAVGGVTAEALLERLSPNYALAQQVAPDDARIHAETIPYESPRGGGKFYRLAGDPPIKSGKGFARLRAGLAGNTPVLNLKGDMRMFA